MSGDENDLPKDKLNGPMEKLLREIEEAFRLSVDDKKAVSKVIADMTMWGTKKTAMDTKKNI